RRSRARSAANQRAPLHRVAGRCPVGNRVRPSPTTTARRCAPSSAPTGTSQPPHAPGDNTADLAGNTVKPAEHRTARGQASGPPSAPPLAPPPPIRPHTRHRRPATPPPIGDRTARLAPETLKAPTDQP